MTDWIPDTDYVKNRYLYFDGGPEAEDSDDFDRWLQKVKAEAWAEGQQSGAKWGVQDWTDEYPPADNPYES